MGSGVLNGWAISFLAQGTRRVATCIHFVRVQHRTFRGMDGTYRRASVFLVLSLTGA